MNNYFVNSDHYFIYLISYYPSHYFIKEISEDSESFPSKLPDVISYFIYNFNN
jgi:hypothetical protein